MTHTKELQKIADIMKGARIGTLTSLDGEKLVSRPMGLQQIEFDGDLWFFTYKQSSKIDEITKNPQVNVAFENKGSWLSMSGDALLVEDEAKAKELWNPFLKAWFPDGLDTKGLALLKVTPQSVEYWDSDNPQVVQLLGMVKAAVTGEQAKGGENKTVEL